MKEYKGALQLERILMCESPADMIRQNEEELFSLIPELELCKDFDQNNPWHIYDVYEHILHVVDAVPQNLMARYAALFHDIGKPSVYYADENGIGHFYGHWVRSVEIFRNFSKVHQLDAVFVDSVSDLIFYHDINFGKLSDEDISIITKKLTSEELRLLFAIKRADLLAQNPQYHGLLKDYDVQEEMILKRKNENGQHLPM